MAKPHRLFLVPLAAALLVFLPIARSAPTARAATAEQITSFQSDIEVGQDGLVDITETITYYFPYSRHGIYRDLPLVYDDGHSRWRMPLSVESVSDDRGQAWPYTLETGSAGLRIKIGDPDRTIEGTHVYVIRYRASGALRYFDDHDELYWNVTGTSWTVPIVESSATVSLPDGIDVTAVRCFTGPQASTDENCQKSFSGRQATFSSDGNLTVVVGWPSDLVAEVLPQPDTLWTRLVPSLNAGTFLPLLLPLAVLLIMYSIWRRRGRDAAVSPTLVVEYEPPDNLPPAELGTMMDGSPDLHDITASIVDLAVRGYIKIREVTTRGLIFSSKDHELELLKTGYKSDSQLKSYEVTVLGAIFPLTNKVRLSTLKTDHAFSAHLDKIKRQLGDQVVVDGYYATNPRAERVKWVVAPIGLLAVVGWFGAPFALAVLIGLGLNSASVAFSAIMAVVIYAAFGWQMPRLTPKGAEAYGKAKGFQEYITRAEKYRIQWQEKENVFERFLPYAMVFKVSEKWAKAFAGIDIKQPDWYEGAAFQAGTFNAVAFTSAFGSFSSSLNSAVLSRPSQSGGGSGFGGGGGGFSGGGGGGGGGGSW